MRWPRGKYNGKKIEGAQISVTLHVLFWFWRPRFSWDFGTPRFHWLCFTVRARPEYL